MEREIFDHDHDDFRASVRRFVADEIFPNFEKFLDLIRVFLVDRQVPYPPSLTVAVL